MATIEATPGGAVVSQCKRTRRGSWEPGPHHKHRVHGGDRQGSNHKASSPCLPPLSGGQIPMEGGHCVGNWEVTALRGPRKRKPVFSGC